MTEQAHTRAAAREWLPGRRTNGSASAVNSHLSIVIDGPPAAVHEVVVAHEPPHVGSRAVQPVA
jgi:hypothetical protein